MKTAIVGVLFLIIGLTFGGVALMLGLRSSSALSGTTANGTIVKLERRPGVRHARGHSGGTVPVVRFDAEGATHQIRGRISTSPSPYRIGGSVVVVYPPGRPQDGRIHSFVEMWLLPTIFGSIGGVLGLSGAAVIVVMAVRHATREPPEVLTISDSDR